MELYFNHSPMIGASETSIAQILRELVKLSGRLNREQAGLRFFSSLYGVLLADQRTISQYLYQLPKTEDIVNAILYVDHGPHFNDCPTIPGLQIDPPVPVASFGEKLLHICYTDHQKWVVSCDNEAVLLDSSYLLSASNSGLKVTNLVGETAIAAYFQATKRYDHIREVIQEIERVNSPRLVLLPDARKSTRGHDFQGCFQEVYQALVALETVELKALLEQATEAQRIQLFRTETGLEISKEHDTTLNDPLYRNQRMFTIPGRGRELFEWHVKIGNHIRIHYFVDKENQVVYVGHCGKHLGVSSYRS